jgi:DNA-binding XRE family transcriptional regulator
MPTMAKPVNKDWAARLAALRERLGETQAGMAERLGCSRRAYIYWETGQKVPLKVYQAEIVRLEKSKK